MEESPVKVYHNQTSLDVKPYNCLICGRRSGDETLRKPGEKGVYTFITALETRGNCNGFTLTDYQTVFNFEIKKLQEGEDRVRWHPKCYSTFTNSTNLKYLCLKEPEKQATRRSDENTVTKAINRFTKMLHVLWFSKA